MALEDMVKKLFVENPDLSEDEAVIRLKEMKDPATNKSLWKAATIRNRVNTYLRKKEGEPHAVHVESPVEEKGSGSDLKIEGKEIEPHKPKDPFAIKSETMKDSSNYNIIENRENVGEMVDQIKDVKPVVDTEQIKKEIVDDVSRKVLERVSAETKSFKEETISIVSDLKSSMVDAFTDMKEEMIGIQARGLPSYESIVKYDDIKLKESTIVAIQENTKEKELKEESEYIDNLIENEKEYISILQTYHKLVALAKEAKKGVQLRLFYENDRLSYNKKPVGRFGINPKNLAAGILIGISIGIAIVLIYTALTAAPPPIVPPVP